MSKLNKVREDRFCMRCGISESDVKENGSGCKVWGKYYGNHRYMTKSEAPENEYNILTK